MVAPIQHPLAADHTEPDWMNKLVALVQLVTCTWEWSAEAAWCCPAAIVGVVTETNAEKAIEELKAYEAAKRNIASKKDPDALQMKLFWLFILIDIHVSLWINFNNFFVYIFRYTIQVLNNFDSFFI